MYLPGEQITLNTATGTTTGIRYFGLPGGGTAARGGRPCGCSRPPG
jgi:hypothetical protein